VWFWGTWSQRAKRWITLIVLGWIAYLLVFTEWMTGTGSAEVEVIVTVVDGNSGRPVRGAMVLSIPTEAKMGDEAWRARQVAYHLTKSSDPDWEPLRSGFGVSDERGRAAGRFETLYSIRGTLWESWTTKSKPNRFAVAGIAVEAKGYETCWIPSTNAELEHAKGDARVRIDFATVPLSPE